MAKNNEDDEMLFVDCEDPNDTGRPLWGGGNSVALAPGGNDAKPVRPFMRPSPLEKAEADNRLLRALLWAITNEARPWCFWYYNPETGTHFSLTNTETGDAYGVGFGLDLSLIPDPVKARLVRDWEAATK